MNGKIKLGLVTTFPPGTGSLNEYAHYFVNALLEKRSDVREVILFVDKLPKGVTYDEVEQMETAVPLSVVECWHFGSLFNARSILNAVKKAKPDAVLFNIQFASFGAGKIPATLGLLTPMLLKRAGFPTAVLLHNIMETVDLESAGFGGNKLIETIIRAVGTVVTKLILEADFVALTIPKYVEILQSKYDADNVILAPHGSFDTSVTTPNFDLPEGPMQIMTFGKFGTYKKVEDLIEAFKLLATDERPPLELVIAGTSNPNAANYLEDLAEANKDVANIRFTGYVAEEDVPVIFGDSAAVVFPYTSTTGSSGVLHQAGDYGKAVVLPNIGDFAEVIAEEGYTGEFFEPNDVNALAQAIANVIDNPERRREIGQQNFMAAHGIPITDIVDWYLLHIGRLISEREEQAKQSLLAPA